MVSLCSPHYICPVLRHVQIFVFLFLSFFHFTKFMQPYANLYKLTTYNCHFQIVLKNFFKGGCFPFMIFEILCSTSLGQILKCVVFEANKY